MQCFQRPEEGSFSPGAEVMGNCKPPGLGAEHQTQVLSGRAVPALIHRTFFPTPLIFLKAPWDLEHGGILCNPVTQKTEAGLLGI